MHFLRQVAPRRVYRVHLCREWADIQRNALQAAILQSVRQQEFRLISNTHTGDGGTDQYITVIGQQGAVYRLLAQGLAVAKLPELLRLLQAVAQAGMVSQLIQRARGTVNGPGRPGPRTAPWQFHLVAVPPAGRAAAVC